MWGSVTIQHCATTAHTFVGGTKIKSATLLRRRSVTLRGQRTVKEQCRTTPVVPELIVIGWITTWFEMVGSEMVGRIFFVMASCRSQKSSYLRLEKQLICDQKSSSSATRNAAHLRPEMQFICDQKISSSATRKAVHLRPERQIVSTRKAARVRLEKQFI